MPNATQSLEDLRRISQCFSAPVLSALARTGRSAPLSGVLRDTPGALSGTLAQAFNSLFGALCRSYRAEYVYKNLLATRLLLGRHSLRTATLMSEFRAGESKADIVIINGTSSVYEIKTEFDSTDRLAAQIASYRQLFDRIHVVTHPDLVDIIRRQVADDIGIITLNRRLTVTTVREPLPNRSHVDPEVIFSSLRQGEYCGIIEAEFGSVPDVPNARLYGECRALFGRLSPEQAHDSMVRALRARVSDRRSIEFVRSLPRSLKLIALTARFSQRERDRLLLQLRSPASALL
jgi:hypothetical protein